MAQAPEQPTTQSQSRTTSPKAGRMHRRSRSGCFTCRLRRKKCSEHKPVCLACRNLGLCCDWKRPSWWANNDTRREQKDRIKSQIKRTKSTEKETMKVPNSRHSTMPPPDMYDFNRGQRDGSEDSYDEVDPTFAGTPGYYDPHAQQYYGAPITDVYGYTYEVDVKTERQIWLNDIPTRRDSSISTFSTFMPPPAQHVLPSYQGDSFLHQAQFETPVDNWNGGDGFDFNYLDFNAQQMPLSTHTGQIEVEECDQPLLNHLIENVLPLMYPVRQTNQHDCVKSDVILPALETNKAYLHACLSAAAEHMKSMGIDSGTTEQDAARHMVAFVSEAVANIGDQNTFLASLEATLATIYLYCIIGHADAVHQIISWRDHLEAARKFAETLQMPQLLLSLPAETSGAQAPFNMSLIAWIDIVGATMKGSIPFFADTYRERHCNNGGTAGLYELMGCSDNVMFLLSEAACLDSLVQQKRTTHIETCGLIQSLGHQLTSTEIPGEQFCYPYSSSGSFRPRQLSRNITAIYRKAVRLYILGLIPTYDRFSSSSVEMVQDICSLMQFIPSGPEGYDRSVIWPLLIAGSASIPGSPFRKLFSDRVEALGIAATQGNFGRLVKLLYEVWRRNDEISLSATVCEATPVTAGAHSPGPLAVLDRTETPIQPRTIHWRDVMRENKWDFLLL